ncbi:MAG: hypothetical protein IPO58_22570 [Betaproteobacteria bacterium]|nr:hypothetical protein [Betaproteobacteria bacterium]
MTKQGSSYEQGVQGASLLTMITSERTSYAYPNTAVKDDKRTDCSGTTCTYAEEMTNFANWWTYYHTRMQMMKTSASNAFAEIDSPADIAVFRSRFRVGYMSINNNAGNGFVNLNEFATTQKGTWYSKLTGAVPNSSTPLRATLSDAGRLYAGVLGNTYNSVAVTDPLQYSCQQNYTILSTDGFWNENSGYNKLNGSTSVGNQDAGLPRPLYDGGSATVQARTSALQHRTVAAEQTQRSPARRRRHQHFAPGIRRPERPATQWVHRTNWADTNCNAPWTTTGQAGPGAGTTGRMDQCHLRREL